MMNKSTNCLSILVLLSALLLAGCALTPTSPVEDPSTIHTQAVHTVSAQLTLDAGSTAVAMLTQLAQVTSVPPSSTPTSTPVPATHTPTHTPPPPVPTNTPLPATPTRASEPCDRLRFVSDVTVPDGKTYLPGAKFTKIWRLENIGTCTWTRDYDLVFTGGDQMSTVGVLPLLGNIPPGSMVDLSVELTAPDYAGIYTDFWQLRNASGVLFGGGDQADEPFYVRINVAEVDTILYDMLPHYCWADWANSRITLDCPTQLKDESTGFIYKDDVPYLETGNRDNESALVTHPDEGGWMRFELLGEQGLIAGTFPAILIQRGDRFEAVVGCMYGHAECSVIFYLLVQKPNGNYDLVASWQEIYDGKITPVSVDLSEWAGKEIRVTLVVEANGPSQGDYAFWLHPRLVR